MVNGSCKQPGVNISKEERLKNHKIKMAAKRRFRDYMFARDYAEQPVYTPANLGRSHPDYGMSMTDHLSEKAQRNNEKSS